MSRRRSQSPRGPLIVALGSGSGGAGRTTLALELWRVFGRLSVPTVLVDGSLAAPMLAPALGIDPRSLPSTNRLHSGGHLEDFVLRSEEEALGVLTLVDASEPADWTEEGAAARLIERLRRLGDKLVVIDLPAGRLPFWSDLLVLADAPILVSRPDGWSVRPLVAYVEALCDRSTQLGAEHDFRSYLVLNDCRDASERDLGEVLCHAIWRRLGHYPRYLGPVDHDDRRWFHLRHGDSCPPLSSGVGLGVQVDEIAKRILSLEEFDQVRPRAEQIASGAAWLGLSTNATAADLRSQYRRLWEGYRRESAISQEVLEAEPRRRIIAELEQTYRALQMALDEGRGVQDVTPAEIEPEDRDDELDERLAEPAQLLRGGPAVDECGEALAWARQDRGMSLRELSLRTRIGLRYLEAIERMEVDALPPAVYLRGYLREIARVLELPVESLLKRYLDEIDALRQATSSGLGVH